MVSTNSVMPRGDEEVLFCGRTQKFLGLIRALSYIWLYALCWLNRLEENETYWNTCPRILILTVQFQSLQYKSGGGWIPEASRRFPPWVFLGGSETLETPRELQLQLPMPSSGKEWKFPRASSKSQDNGKSSVRFKYRFLKRCSLNILGLVSHLPEIHKAWVQTGYLSCKV
jgi:hypothetical protein